MNASLCSLPDLEWFKCDSEQEEAKNGSSGNSHNSVSFDNSENTSDSTPEVSTFSCPFCLNSFNTYDDGMVHVKQGGEQGSEKFDLAASKKNPR